MSNIQIILRTTIDGSDYYLFYLDNNYLNAYVDPTYQYRYKKFIDMKRFHLKNGLHLEDIFINLLETSHRDIFIANFKFNSINEMNSLCYLFKQCETFTNPLIWISKINLERLVNEEQVEYPESLREIIDRQYYSNLHFNIKIYLNNLKCNGTYILDECVRNHIKQDKSIPELMFEPFMNIIPLLTTEQGKKQIEESNTQLESLEFKKVYSDSDISTFSISDNGKPFKVKTYPPFGTPFAKDESKTTLEQPMKGIVSKSRTFNNMVIKPPRNTSTNNELINDETCFKFVSEPDVNNTSNIKQLTGNDSPFERKLYPIINHPYNQIKLYMGKIRCENNDPFIVHIKTVYDYLIQNTNISLTDDEILEKLHDNNGDVVNTIMSIII